MEQVDSLIINFAKYIGWDTDEEYIVLNDISTDDLIYLVCLFLMNAKSLKNTKISKVPNKMADKYSFCKDLVTQCKEMGFKGDIAIQSLIYGNIFEIRRILLHLMEISPKESSETTSNLNKKQMVIKNLTNYFNQSKNSSWFPYYCWISPSNHFKILPSSSLQKLSNNNLLTIEVLVASLLENNLLIKETKNDDTTSLKLLKDWESTNIPSHIRITKDVNEKNNTRTSITSNINDGLQNLNLKDNNNNNNNNNNNSHNNNNEKQIEELLEKIQSNKSEINNLKAAYQLAYQKLEKMKTHNLNSNDELQKFENEIVALKNNIKIDDALLILMKDHDNSVSELEKLKKSIEDKCNKSMNIWSDQKQHLQIEIDTLINEKSSFNKLMDDKQMLLEEERVLSEEIVQLDEKIKTKKVESVRLAARSVYIDKLFEICANLGKQKRQIDQFVNDVFSIQRIINNLSDKTSRAFSLVEDVVFIDATLNEFGKDCYLSIGNLMEAFEKIFITLDNFKQTSKSNVEMEEILNRMNYDKIEKDIIKIRADIEALKKDKNLK